MSFSESLCNGYFACIIAGKLCIFIYSSYYGNAIIGVNGYIPGKPSENGSGSSRPYIKHMRRMSMKTLSKKLIAWTIVLTLALALIPFAAPTASAWGEIGKKGYLPVISVGASHCIALASNGDVYTWGNDDEALGLGVSDTTRPFSESEI